jgi:hypothetical protein
MELVKAHVYTIEPGGIVKMLAAEVPFAALPKVGEFIALSLQNGETCVVVEEVWHTPAAICPLNKLVVSVTGAKPPRDRVG